MLWLYAVIFATLMGGIGQVLHRRITKDEDVRSYSFLFTLIAGLSFIPVMFLEDMTLPSGNGWLTFFAAAGLWFLINITGFNATKRTEVGVYAPLSKTSIIFVLLLASVFLGENVTLAKILGTLVIFTGIVMLTWKKGSLDKLKDKGIQLVLLTALLTAMVTLLDKHNMTLGISKGFYGMVMYLIPCALHGVRAKSRGRKIKRIIKNQGPYVLLVGLIYGVLYYYLFLYAYSFPEAEISIIYPISQLKILLAVILGYLWLGETQSLGKKLAASALMIAGAVLVAI